MLRPPHRQTPRLGPRKARRASRYETVAVRPAPPAPASRPRSDVPACARSSPSSAFDPQRLAIPNRCRGNRIGYNDGLQPRIDEAADMTTPAPPRILSGVQPSGKLHLGNYFGAIKQHIALQDRGPSFYFIADYHALTTIGDLESD